jgi:hypothetical protein
MNQYSKFADTLGVRPLSLSADQALIIKRRWGTGADLQTSTQFREPRLQVWHR